MGSPTGWFNINFDGYVQDYNVGMRFFLSGIIRTQWLEQLVFMLPQAQVGFASGD